MIEIKGLVAGCGGLDILRGVDLSVDRGGLSLATHATVLTAGTVALTGTAAEIEAHPGLMDLFFGDAQTAGGHGAGIA